jgi:hypothetical protein
VRGAEKPPTEETLDAAVETDESEKTMSLLSGVARPEEMPEVSDTEFGDAKGPGKLMSQGTMVLVALLVVAGLVIYAMRTVQNGGTSGNKDVDAKIEQALAKISQPYALSGDDALAPGNTAKLFKDTQEIVEEFSNDPAKREVPIDYVKKNPFVMPTTATPEAPVGAGPARPDENALAIKKLQAELKNLKLQSVMGGNRPVAIIDGELVQPGGTVGSFTVKAIKGTTVELEGAGQPFTLTMEEKKPK